MYFQLFLDILKFNSLILSFRSYYKLPMGRAARNNGGTGGHGCHPMPGERPNFNRHVLSDQDLKSIVTNRDRMKLVRLGGESSGIQQVTTVKLPIPGSNFPIKRAGTAVKSPGTVVKLPRTPVKLSGPSVKQPDIPSKVPGDLVKLSGT